MKTQNANHSFYKSLANLFFAIAASDKSIAKEEKHAIIKSINNKQINLDLNSEKEQLIYDELKLLIAEQIEATKAFNSFKQYYYKHMALFSKEIKKTLLSITYEIASAYAQKNKSELIMINRLKLLFSSNSKVE